MDPYRNSADGIARFGFSGISPGGVGAFTVARAWRYLSISGYGFFPISSFADQMMYTRYAWITPTMISHMKKNVSVKPQTKAEPRR